jgi:hypothetical protein
MQAQFNSMNSAYQRGAGGGFDQQSNRFGGGFNDRQQQQQQASSWTLFFGYKNDAGIVPAQEDIGRFLTETHNVRIEKLVMVPAKMAAFITVANQEQYERLLNMRRITMGQFNFLVNTAQRKGEAPNTPAPVGGASSTAGPAAAAHSVPAGFGGGRGGGIMPTPTATRGGGFAAPRRGGFGAEGPLFVTPGSTNTAAAAVAEAPTRRIVVFKDVPEERISDEHIFFRLYPHVPSQIRRVASSNCVAAVFDRPAAAQDAFDMLQGKKLQGKPVSVELA